MKEGKANKKGTKQKLLFLHLGTKQCFVALSEQQKSEFLKSIFSIRWGIKVNSLSSENEFPDQV